MIITATDQFGIELPDITKALNEHTELLENLPVPPVDGTCKWYALDNPRAGETCESAGEVLRLATRTVRDMCARGDISAYRYPSRWRIPIMEVARLSMGGDAE